MDIRDMDDVQQAKSAAWEAVRRERDRQDDMWGPIDQRAEELTFGDWIGILIEEVGEMAEAFLNYKFGDGDFDHLYEETIQVAAVGMAIVECLSYHLIVNDKEVPVE